MFTNDNNDTIKYNITEQKILQDGKNEKKRPWRPKKVRNLILTDSYHRLGYHKKANRVWWCGSSLAFSVDSVSDVKKLIAAEFCKDRLCPLCQWRRCLKLFYQVSKIMDVAQERYKDFVPIFLTLTMKNCIAAELPDAISQLLREGWKNFIDHYKTRKLIKGWFRALEVTYDGDEFISRKRCNRRKDEYDRMGIKPGDKNPNYDTFHPHIHAILLVEKSYFKSKDYMQTADWVKLWRTSMGLDYDPVCDVRGIKNNVGKRKEVAEVAKYTLKDTEFLTNDKDKTDKLVEVLGNSLRGRRLFAFGGVLKEIAKELGAEKPDEGDLVHIEDETYREDIAKVLEVYRWNFGLANYVKDNSYTSGVVMDRKKYSREKLTNEKGAG